MDGMWGQFIPMSFLFFFMAFVNTLIDSLKDTLVVTSALGGPEVIPFLTVYAVLPSSLIFFGLFTLASQRFSRESLFNLTVTCFLVFFALFGLYLYPQHDTLHPYGAADGFLSLLPTGLKGLVGMMTNWTFTLFYCVAELWGDVVLSLLFWGLANDITSMDRAKLLYPLFGVGANVAQSSAGRLLKVFSIQASEQNIPFTNQVQFLMALVFGCGVVVIFLHSWISRRFKAVDIIVRGKVVEPTPLRKDGDGDENKLNLRDALSTVLSSPQIKCLAVMALSQGVCTSLLEFAWKAELRRLYPSPGQFNAFMGDVAMWTGIITGAMMFVSPYLFQRIGWRGVASASPTILLYGGVTFFLVALANRMAFPPLADVAMLAPGGAMLLQGLAIGGAVLYIMNRGCKFSLFKPAEEMVYITLDQEARTKGKAAIDVVGAQTGKSSSSILQQVLLLLSGGNLTLVLPLMMVFQVSILRSWLQAVFVLSRYYERTQRQEAKAAALAAAAEGGGAEEMALIRESMERDIEERLPLLKRRTEDKDKGGG